MRRGTKNNNALPRRSSPRRRRGPTDMPFNQLGNAKRLIKYYGNKIRYCPESGKWFVWSGKRWRLDNGAYLKKAAIKVVEKIALEADDDLEFTKTSFEKHQYHSGFKSNILGMIDLAQSLASISIDAFDGEPYLLNILNGTVDLTDGKLYEREKEDYITHLAPVKYASKAKCPRFNKFIHQIMDGDSDLVAYLQRVFGYILTGDTSNQCFFIFYGEGANGKTTLLETFRAILGSYAQHADIGSFMISRNNAGPRNDLASMRGCRLVTTGEAGNNQYLNEPLIKQITGGEPIRARFLYQEAFEFVPDFKLVLQTNHIPRIQGQDLGIRRRVRLIPFNVTISPSKQDPYLLDTLKDELPGILNWAIDGCLEWQDTGLNEPDAVKSATEMVFHQASPVDQFFAEMCEFASDLKVQTSALKNEYSLWCKRNGKIELNSNQFAAELKKHCCKKSMSNGVRYWRGLELKRNN